MKTIEAFLFVFAVGGCICAATWLLIRKLTARWWWRAVLCILFGATIAPAFFRFWGDWAVWPAALVLLNLFDGTDFVKSLMIGGLPVLFCASVMFISWSVMIHQGKGKGSTHSLVRFAGGLAINLLFSAPQPRPQTTPQPHSAAQTFAD